MNRTEPTPTVYIVPSGADRRKKDTFADFAWLAVFWICIAIVIGPLLIVCGCVGLFARMIEHDVKRQKEKDNFNT